MDKHFNVTIFVLLLALLQWLVPAFAPLVRAERSLHGYPRGDHVVQQEPRRRSNLTITFNDENNLYGLTERATCDPGYGLCPGTTKCCPLGDECVTDGCCDAGSVECSPVTCYYPDTETCCANGDACPIGHDCVEGGRCCYAGYIPCGSNACYDPDTEICCTVGIDGGCPKDGSCCGEECCYSDAVCGDDGYCSANLCTEFSTREETRWITEVPVTEITTEKQVTEYFLFDCSEITVVNTDSATLELGEDCILTYYPPPSASASTSTAAHNAAAARSGLLQPRATQAPDAECYDTFTSVVVVTVDYTTTSTSTFVVEATETPTGFSCIPMTVSDEYGDSLILDDECHLSVSFNLAQTSSRITPSPQSASTHPSIPLVGPTSTAGPTATGHITQWSIACPPIGLEAGGKFSLGSVAVAVALGVLVVMTWM